MCNSWKNPLPNPTHSYDSQGQRELIFTFLLFSGNKALCGNMCRNYLLVGVKRSCYEPGLSPAKSSASGTKHKTEIWREPKGHRRAERLQRRYGAIIVGASLPTAADSLSGEKCRCYHRRCVSLFSRFKVRDVFMWPSTDAIERPLSPTVPRRWRGSLENGSHAGFRIS